MSEDNVVNFGGITRLKIPAERVTKTATETEFETVIAIGFEKEGGFYFASNEPSGPEILWLLGLAERKLFDVSEELAGES